MRTHLPGLLISASILLSTAAQAETTPVVPSFFRTIEVRVDTVLIAANLGIVGPASCAPRLAETPVKRR